MGELSQIAAAAYRHDWAEVDRLRAEAADLELHDAAIVGDADMLATLLRTSPTRVNEPASDGFLPLHLACYFARVDATAVLLEAGADPNAVAKQPSRIRPLHAATAARAPDIVALLLDAGADPNVAQAGGYTPLMAAARHDDTAIVHLLLDHGAAPELTDENGTDAMGHAGNDTAMILNKRTN